MPLKVEFLFDFGSPNAYLAELVLPGIEWRTGVKFEYVPFLLGGIFKGTRTFRISRRCAVRFPEGPVPPGKRSGCQNRTGIQLSGACQLLP